MSPAYLVFDLDQTDPIDALLAARDEFPNLKIALEIIDRDTWALDAIELEWLASEFSDHAILIDPQHDSILVLCTECASYIEHGTHPSVKPPAALVELAESSGITSLLESSDSGGYCAGCEVNTYYAMTGTHYYARQ